MRKVEVVVVPADFGRDTGKMFQITEKPAIISEKWGWRSFIALKGTGGEIPDNVGQLGMVGVAIRGLNAFLQAPVNFAEVEPLLDELLTCVMMIRDKTRPDIATALTLIGDDIEEPVTVAWLRSEVLRVHTGFSFADGLSSLVSMIRTSASSQST